MCKLLHPRSLLSAVCFTCYSLGTSLPVTVPCRDSRLVTSQGQLIFLHIFLRWLLICATLFVFKFDPGQLDFSDNRQMSLGWRRRRRTVWRFNQQAASSVMSAWGGDSPVPHQKKMEEQSNASGLKDAMAAAHLPPVQLRLVWSLNLESGLRSGNVIWVTNVCSTFGDADRPILPRCPGQSLVFFPLFLYFIVAFLLNIHLTSPAAPLSALPQR